MEPVCLERKAKPDKTLEPFWWDPGYKKKQGRQAPPPPPPTTTTPTSPQRMKWRRVRLNGRGLTSGAARFARLKARIQTNPKRSRTLCRLFPLPPSLSHCGHGEHEAKLTGRLQYVLRHSRKKKLVANKPRHCCNAAVLFF